MQHDQKSQRERETKHCHENTTTLSSMHLWGCSRIYCTYIYIHALGPHCRPTKENIEAKMVLTFTLSGGNPKRVGEGGASIVHSEIIATF